VRVGSCFDSDVGTLGESNDRVPQHQGSATRKGRLQRRFRGGGEKGRTTRTFLVACRREEKGVRLAASVFFPSLSAFQSFFPLSPPPWMLPAASSRCCFSARGSHAIRLFLSSRNQHQNAPRSLSKATMATLTSPCPSPSQPLPFGDVFFLDSFALRQWSETASGTRFDPQEVSLESVVKLVHDAHAAGSALVDG